MKTTQNLLIETPEGIVELEINHIVLCKNEDEKLVTLSTKIRDELCIYQSETTEAALYLLAKDLPENWEIRSCLSCRYGHFCPVGNDDNELFCVTENLNQNLHGIYGMLQRMISSGRIEVVLYLIAVRNIRNSLKNILRIMIIIS